MKDSLNSPNSSANPTEEITQRVVFKHIIFILPGIIALTMVAVIAIGFIIFFNLNATQNGTSSLAGILTIVVFIILIIVTCLFFGIFWVWRRTKVIITNQHIVDIDQLGIFNRRESTLRLEEIQDIRATINGPLQTILHYGTIVIQTAGKQENFVFDFIPSPNELVLYTKELRKKYHEDKPVSSAKQIN